MSLLIAARGMGATLQWHWEDPFTAAERAKLKHWVTETSRALERLTAPLPFPVHLHMHRLPGRGEPVPWANTRRGEDQGVDFYVDPAWPLDAFLKDWTAAHELSHLLLPYLGSRHSWFAEGFASYLQYQVLAELGVLGHREIHGAYRERVEHAASAYPAYDLGERSFIEASTRLRRQRAYPVYYWGGAVYFMAIDAELQAGSAPSLVALLARYSDCCRLRNDDFPALLAALDRLSGTTLFTARFKALQKGRGFPAYEKALQALSAGNFPAPAETARNKTASKTSKNSSSPQEQ